LKPCSDTASISSHVSLCTGTRETTVDVPFELEHATSKPSNSEVTGKGNLNYRHVKVRKHETNVSNLGTIHFSFKFRPLYSQKGSFMFSERKNMGARADLGETAYIKLFLPEIIKSTVHPAV
jgi:hypothetical protein